MTQRIYSNWPAFYFSPMHRCHHTLPHAHVSLPPPSNCTLLLILFPQFFKLHHFYLLHPQLIAPALSSGKKVHQCFCCKIYRILFCLLVQHFGGVLGGHTFCAGSRHDAECYSSVWRWRWVKKECDGEEWRVVRLGFTAKQLGVGGRGVQ